MRRKITKYFKAEGLKISKQSITDNSFPDFKAPKVKEIRRSAGKYAKFYTDEEIEEIIGLFMSRTVVLKNLWNLFISEKENDEYTNNILGKNTFSVKQLDKIFFKILKVMPTIKHIAEYLEYQIKYTKLVHNEYEGDYAADHEGEERTFDIKYGSITEYEEIGEKYSALVSAKIDKLKSEFLMARII